METKTKVFDADVPDAVRLEVRRNMRQDGWKFKGEEGGEDPHGNSILTQSYERAALARPEPR